MIQQRTKLWYKDMLCLSGEGFLPCSGSRHLYRKEECRERFGPCNDAGTFEWRERGGPEYVAYVSELYERVYQKPLWNCVGLPWHFTRGLLAEEDGQVVDWAQYAISLRRRGRRNRAPTLMKKYRDLRRPMPFKNPKTKPLLRASSTGVPVTMPTHSGVSTRSRSKQVMEATVTQEVHVTRIPDEGVLQSNEEVQEPPLPEEVHVTRIPDQELLRSNEQVLPPTVPQEVHVNLIPEEEVRQSKVAVAQDSKIETYKLVLSAMAKLGERIGDAARERKGLINVEGTKVRNGYRKSLQRLETSKKRLESLQSNLSYWEGKLEDLGKQQTGAFSFRNDAMARRSRGFEVKTEEQGTAPLCTEADICEDAMHSVMENTAFAEGRVVRLRDNTKVQQEIVVTVQGKVDITRQQAISRAHALKAEIKELDALLKFLSHPDEMIQA